MTSKARNWWRRVTGRWTGPGAADLPAVVAPAGLSIAQLGQERRVPAHRFPAVFSAIATDPGEGHRGHEETVAAGSVAGGAATEYPFMDIAVRGLPRAPPSLRGALDGADTIAVAAAVARTVLGVLLPVSAVLALLGLSSSWRPPPSSSPEPASPPGGFLSAIRAVVLGTETILRPGDESPPAALQEARAAEGILQLGACLRAQDGVQTIEMFFSSWMQPGRVSNALPAVAGILALPAPSPKETARRSIRFQRTTGRKRTFRE
jgi:hypothetical protein